MSYTSESQQPAKPARALSARALRARAANDAAQRATTDTSKRAQRRAAERETRRLQQVAELAVVNAARTFAQASDAVCKRKIHNTMPARTQQPARTLYATPATEQLAVTPARVAALKRSADISRAADKTEQRATRRNATPASVRTNDSQVIMFDAGERTSDEYIAATRKRDLEMLRERNARKRLAGERI